jgi:hypothetical protein
VENLSAAHDAHVSSLVAPVAVENLPAAHSTHVLASAAYWPAAHTTGAGVVVGSGVVVVGSVVVVVGSGVVVVGSGVVVVGSGVVVVGCGVVVVGSGVVVVGSGVVVVVGRRVVVVAGAAYCPAGHELCGDDRCFIVLAETKPSKRHIPVWARYSPLGYHRRRRRSGCSRRRSLVVLVVGGGVVDEVVGRGAHVNFCPPTASGSSYVNSVGPKLHSQFQSPAEPSGPVDYGGHDKHVWIEFLA